jgi:peptidoglycan L-alanyl-D-glutamate endopeptidase CwlK
MNDIINDSAMTLDQILKLKQEMPAPEEVLDKQRLVEVQYFSFDNKLHRGQIVVDLDLVDDVNDAFELIKNTRFPIESVIPMGSKLMTDDEKSVAANNSSGFSYRNIAKTDRLSNHSFGRAIDINPWLNPYIRSDYYHGGDYDPTAPGTITKDCELVKFLKKRGWEWGGDWTDRKDYQHFQKPVANTAA